MSIMLFSLVLCVQCCGLMKMGESDGHLPKYLVQLTIKLPLNYR